MKSPTPKYSIGERVSVSRWAHSGLRTGWPIGQPAEVALVEPWASSESGWMVTVEGPGGRVTTLDERWLDRWLEGQQ